MRNPRKFLGQTVNTPSRELDLIPWKGQPITIRLDATEFTSFCPVTGQPDFAKLQIEYSPGEQIVETKSMKLYLWSFREERQFNELLVDGMASDLFKQIKPRWLRVTGNFFHRGGIAVNAVAVRGKAER